MEGLTVELQAARSNEANAISQCPKCGTKMPASRPSDRCPVCQLRGALAAKTESALKDDSARSDVMPPEFELTGVSAGDLIIMSS